MAHRHLSLLLQGYNEIRSLIRPHELDLLRERFPDIRDTLMRGVHEYTWIHSTLDDYITSAHSLIWREMHPRLITVCICGCKLSRAHLGF